MMRASPRGHVLLTLLAALLVLGLGAYRAEAQWGLGFGGGLGFGLYGGNFVPYIQHPGNFLNQVALSQMSHVHGPPGSNPYTTGLYPYAHPAASPNAYYNHVRDNGFVDQYNVYRREPSYYRSTSARGPRMTPTALTIARSRPVVPLASFYTEQNQLIWPADAPLADLLKEKRATFDQASGAVLDELRKNGVASVAAVTEARQKLLDYGRPALHYVRTHETARVADTVHVFLLELYDSLAQAAYPLGTATAGTPAS